MGTIIGMINEKGGVGKTSGVITMSEILGLAGYKVLLVDLDPQRNASTVYKKEEDQNKYPSVEEYHALFAGSMSRDEILSLVCESEYENVSIIPGSEYLKELLYFIRNENEKTSGAIRPKFKNNISLIKNDYDYIIIDNSPFDSETSRCALCASDYVLTPSNLDGFSFDGIVGLTKTIHSINSRYGTNVSYKGIYFTRAQMNTVLYRQLDEEYGDFFKEIFIPISIRHSTAVSEANTVYLPLVTYAKHCPVVTDYVHLLQALNLMDLKHIKQFNKKVYGEKKKYEF